MFSHWSRSVKNVYGVQSFVKQIIPSVLKCWPKQIYFTLCNEYFTLQSMLFELTVFVSVYYEQYGNDIQPIQGNLGYF